ncbi:MAG: EndoU domain-containing protein, partial [Selenomonadaceae bacterium]|nr:EndoU domain-containing protein [Selenomonadaceae bacterium]
HAAKAGMSQGKEGRTLKSFMRIVAVAAMLLLLVISGCARADEASSGSSAGKPQAVSGTSSTKKATGVSSKYTIKDIEHLENTQNFAKGALEHIFDGTINKKGKATGYHYSMIEDSKGHILEGTRSNPDAHGVFTAKVRVGDVKKNGFSSFYPETWSPQEVVDAINEAYEDAVNNPENPRGDLWIGHSGKLEIDMYLNEKKKIVTAYPIFQENKAK